MSTAARRVDSVDLLRGAVIAIMLLDHTRDFVHSDALNFDPSDPAKTSVILFFTRWITHFCAPVFVFLAGTGAFLRLARGESKADLSRFLITRGLWLVLLEFTVIRVIVWFNLDYHFAFIAEVIWAIGVSMIVLAALIRLPLRAIAAFGIAMIALHNLLDKIQVGPGTSALGLLAPVWMVLHQPGVIFLTPKVYGFVAYPLIPWIGVLAAGYAFGAFYQMEAERRRRLLFRLGWALTVAFVVLRAVNLYGDPARWSGQRSVVFTALSFLRVTKYPPSLLFLLMTLGPAIIALAGFERAGRGWLTRTLITFGRVPLFFFIAQWPVAHGLAVLACYLAGQPLAWQFAGLLERPSPNPGNLGFGLRVVYALWIIGLLLLYPLCRWFARVKRRRNEWWLSYL
ncbi:MAG TPA: heparan-alpha-glucosaminide N-acetyltransferase domain-containing protein [Blastocatellia bacterium]|nr:heparan-alpha-glucosaminide N-acetyltransferase domain-containing protein [Blastocatellia bacterium]